MVYFYVLCTRLWQQRFWHQEASQGRSEELIIEGADIYH